MTTTDKIIEKYLDFGGERNREDFSAFRKQVKAEKENHPKNSREYICLDFIEKKLLRGIGFCLKYNSSIYVIIEDTIEDIEEGFKEKSNRPVSGTKRKPTRRKKKGLGKIVDSGKVSPRGKSDMYWRNKGIDLVFLPGDKKVRIGETIPETYKYYDMRFLEDYYGLRAFEFGNWLSQQDRLNYLSGLGLALFDLHKAIGFAPKKISIKDKLAVAFGARGRGKALAHFEVGTFTINLTRYSRPTNASKRPDNFRRVELILKDGGVGSFAHEYGHALDYFGGLYVDKGDTHSLTDDDSTRTGIDKTQIKKSTLRGLMEKLLAKIIWRDADHLSAYYQRLEKAANGRTYFIQRNEIFARAFEVYVQYKLLKKKQKNIFLNKVKYSPKFYLTIQEMKKIEPAFDALMSAIKKHL